MKSTRDYFDEDSLYQQYLSILDERDDAVEAGETAFVDGFLAGMAVMAIVFLLLSLFGVIL